MDTRIKVFIAIDQCITRLGLKVLCQETIPNCEQTEISSIGELFKLIKSEKPDLLIMDLMFTNINCLSLVSELIQHQNNLNILVISNNTCNTYATRIMSSGAKGFINNTIDNDSIKTAIYRISRGEYFINQASYLEYVNHFNNKNVSDNPFELLSNKELEIVHYLAQGLSTGAISEKSRLANSTVSTYKNRIFNKLKINNLISLIQLANTYNFL